MRHLLSGLRETAFVELELTDEEFTVYPGFVEGLGDEWCLLSQYKASGRRDGRVLVKVDDIISLTIDTEELCQTLSRVHEGPRTWDFEASLSGVLNWSLVHSEPVRTRFAHRALAGVVVNLGLDVVAVAGLQYSGVVSGIEYVKCDSILTVELEGEDLSSARRLLRDRNGEGALTRLRDQACNMFGRG